MAHTYENPANGYRETISELSSLWMFLFGLFYLMYKGLWGHVFVWVLLVFVPGILSGGPALVLCLPIAAVAYAICITGILRRRYLKNGWKEVDQSIVDAGAVPNPFLPAVPAGSRSSVVKKCPYCAEEIKAEAVKCRYCQTDLAV